VDDIPTGQTFPFQSGGVTELDLSVNTCSLTTASTEGGSVTVPGEEGPYTYGCGEDVAITAVAEDCYRFTGWTGDTTTIADDEDPTTEIHMDDDYSITANFAMPGSLFDVVFNQGWNTFSTPISLHHGIDTWAEFITANELAVSMLWGYDAAAESWIPISGGDKIEPLYGFYVNTSEAGIAHIIPNENETLEPTRELSRGTHLIGPAPASLEDVDVVTALTSIYYAGESWGYIMVVSPYINSPNNWAYVRDAPDPPMMTICRACWVVMERAGEFVGETTTPLEP